MDGTASSSSSSSAFILHPNASVPSSDAAERFASMSVTRNPGATIHEERRARPVRVPASLTVDDIAGARPRSLPPRASGGFYGTQDVEGAQPKVLHRGISYTPKVVEGAWAAAAGALALSCGLPPVSRAPPLKRTHARTHTTRPLWPPHHRLSAPRHKVSHQPRH